MLEHLAEVPAEAVEEAAVPGLATHAEAVRRVGAAAAIVGLDLLISILINLMSNRYL